MIRQKLAIFIICLIVLVAIAGGYYWYISSKTFTIRIGYLRADVHQSSYFISRVKGWWLEAGIKTEGYEFEAGPAEMEAFRAGALDIGFVGTPPAVTAISRGTRVKIIASVNAEGSALVVRKDLYEQGLNSIEGLRGRVIAMPLWGSIQSVMLIETLQKHGISKEDVKLLEMPPADMVTAMEGKSIDAFIAWAPFPSMAIMEGVGNMLIDSSQMWSGHPCCCLVVSTNLIKTHPEIVRQMLEVHIKATKFIVEHPDEAARIVAGQVGLSYAVVRESFNRIKWVYRPDVDGTLRFAETLLKLGLIERRPTRDELFNLTFYEEVTGEVMQSIDAFSISAKNSSLKTRFESFSVDSIIEESANPCWLTKKTIVPVPYVESLVEPMDGRHLFSSFTSLLY